jgi:hypothetical protein
LPPPATSTVTIPPTLSIGADGSFLARGMAVTSVGSSSFQGEIWGITYTVNWSGKLPQFYFRNGNNDTNWVPTAQVNVGDIVGVSGMVSTSDPLVVNAQVVRDYSIGGPRPRYPGYPFQESALNNPGSNGNNGNPSGTNGYGGGYGNNSNTGFSFENQLNSLGQELQNLETMFRNQFGGR